MVPGAAWRMKGKREWQYVDGSKSTEAGRAPRQQEREGRRVGGERRGRKANQPHVAARGTQKTKARSQKPEDRSQKLP